MINCEKARTEEDSGSKAPEEEEVLANVKEDELLEDNDYVKKVKEYGREGKSTRK